MTTGNDIVNLALKGCGQLGLGQTPLQSDAADGLSLLNMMLAQWNRKRWLVYRLVDTAFMSTGAQSYTVGPSGNFNIARADRLEGAYARLNPTQENPVDYPMTILESREDYSRISLKSLTTFPQFVWLDSNYPSGNVYFWPIPNTTFELHILTKAVLTAFTTLSEDVALPPEYEEALWMNLALRMCAVYQLDPPPHLAGLAKGALETIRSANFQISRLQMPVALTRDRLYNIYSDQTY